MKKIVGILFCIILISTILFSGCIGNHSDFDKYVDIRYQDIPNTDPNLISLDIYVPKIGSNSINKISDNPQFKYISDQFVKKYNFKN